MIEMFQKHVLISTSVDIEVGDIIIPKSEKRTIPVQLDGFVSPEISTYSLESTIAEKYDAILQRLEMTSRMKDFYDIYYLSNMYDFEGRKLQEAIMETLENRGTSYGKGSLNQITDFVNDSEMNKKWKQFLRQLKIKEPGFEEVLKGISCFLEPVWEAIVNEDEFFKMWNKEKNIWKSLMKNEVLVKKGK